MRTDPVRGPLTAWTRSFPDLEVIDDFSTFEDGQHLSQKAALIFYKYFFYGYQKLPTEEDEEATKRHQIMQWGPNVHQTGTLVKSAKLWIRNNVTYVLLSYDKIASRIFLFLWYVLDIYSQ